jgi:glycosyltransferase involved in cell wall biosynthesis
VVVSEGRGRDWLARHLATVDDGRLVLRDFAPFSELPTVLASADVLISILEPAASRFSVPSKVLTYLCAGRPVLAVMDPGNAAARLLTTAGAGVVVDGSAGGHAVAAALREILDEPGAAMTMGAAGRCLAERDFDIRRIADRFEDVVRDGVRRR